MKQNIVFSVDDYSSMNNKAAGLLLKYELPCIFYIEIEAHRQEGSIKDVQDQIVNLSQMGFELGGHSWTHPADMKVLDSTQLEREVYDCKKVIEDYIGKEVESYAYPRGRFDLRTKEALKKAGYKYARTTRIGDCTDLSDPLEIPCSIHVYQRKEYKGKDWLEVAKKKWDRGEDMHVFFHSWEINRDRQWDKLEQFMQYVTGR